MRLPNEHGRPVFQHHGSYHDVFDPSQPGLMRAGPARNTSGGSRVGLWRLQPPPPFVGLGDKAQGLEAALCSFSVFN